MTTIKIQAKQFFEQLKSHETSMWSIFAEMINSSEEQLIVFLDENEKEIAHYVLPDNIDQLNKDRKEFAEAFKGKLEAFNH